MNSKQLEDQIRYIDVMLLDSQRYNAELSKFDESVKAKQKQIAALTREIEVLERERRAFEERRRNAEERRAELLESLLMAQLAEKPEIRRLVQALKKDPALIDEVKKHVDS